MKTTAFVVLLLLGAGVFAQTPVIWTFGGNKTPYPGFPASTPGINQSSILPDGQVTTDGIPLAIQLDYLNSKIGFQGILEPRKNQIILGHSQGGLRALAYGKRLVEDAKARGKDPGEYLSGIITINSPVQGFSPLNQGLGVLQNKIVRYQAKVKNGLSALSDAFCTDMEGVLTGQVEARYGTSAKETARLLLVDPSFLVTHGLDELMAPGIYRTNPDPNSVQDMGRYSAWYQANLSAPMTMRVEWVSTGGWPSYSGYPVVYSTPPHGLIPEEVKVGYIYGDNTDFDTSLALALKVRTSSGEPEFSSMTGWEITAWTAKIFLACQATTAVATTAANVLGGEVTALVTADWWADFYDNLSFLDDTYHHELLAQAETKRQYQAWANELASIANDPGSIVNDLYVSTSHDGLVPVTDQFDPNIGSSTVQNLGGSSIDSRVPYIRTSVNHFYARFDAANWGSEGYANVGFSKDKVGRDGNIRIYLSKLGVDPLFGTTDQRWDLRGRQQ